MDLIIVRHGLPLAVTASPGAPADPHLSEIGRQQAEATADFLAGEHITAVISSPLRRARETADPLARRLGFAVQVVDGLAEVDADESTYVPDDELVRGEHATLAALLADPFTLFEPVGGYDAFRTRVIDAFATIADAHPDGTVSVFCHGGVMMTFLAHLYGLDHPFHTAFDYCGVMRVSTGHRGSGVRSVNETGHVRSLLDPNSTIRPWELLNRALSTETETPDD